MCQYYGRVCFKNNFYLFDESFYETKNEMWRHLTCDAQCFNEILEKALEYSSKTRYQYLLWQGIFSWKGDAYFQQEKDVHIRYRMNACTLNKNFNQYWIMQLQGSYKMREVLQVFSAMQVLTRLHIAIYTYIYIYI